MENKKGLVVFNKSRNSWTGRVSIPHNFLSELGITREDREIIIGLNSDKEIIIRKKTANDLIEDKKVKENKGIKYKELKMF